MTLRLIVALTCAVRIAAAQPAGEADRLFAEGRSLADAGNYEAACERFAASYQLEPAVGTKLNLGDCHEHLGKLLEALRLFEEAAAELERSGEAKRAKFGRDRAAAIATRLVTVIVKPAEPNRAGLAISIAGRGVAPAAEIRERVEPGTIAVVASVPDQPPFSTTVTASGGASVTIDIPAFAAPVVAEPATRRARGRVRLAWGLAAGGGASAIVASVLTLKARSDYNTVADGPSCTRVTGGITCDATGEAAIDDAQRLADIGTGFAIASGALIGAAAVIYLTAPRETIVVTPVASVRALGLAATVRF